MLTNLFKTYLLRYGRGGIETLCIIKLVKLSNFDKIKYLKWKKKKKKIDYAINIDSHIPT